MNDKFGLCRGKTKGGHWITGAYHKHQLAAVCFANEDSEDNYEHLIITSSFADFGMPRKLQAHSIIPESLGEYIGLRDDDKKQIFTGDILELSYHWSNGEKEVYRAFVEFGNPNALNSWGYQLKFEDNFQGNPDILLWVEAEVENVKCKIINNLFDYKNMSMAKDT